MKASRISTATAAAILVALMTPLAAQAQLYFRPFGGLYYERFGDDDAPPAPYASRRAVASILAREGFRLVGPLGHRGEQIVATGLSQSDGEVRFFVDPYEGVIIRSRRLGPPPQYDRAPDDDVAAPLGGPRIRELDRDESQRAESPHRERHAARRHAPTKREAAETRGTVRQEQATAPTTPALTTRPEAQRTSGAAASQRAIEAKAAPGAANATNKPEAAKPAPRVVWPLPSQPNKPDAPAAVAETTKPKNPAPPASGTTSIAKPAPAAASPAQHANAQTASHVAGGASHRAIVPPTTPKPPAATLTP